MAGRHFTFDLVLSWRSLRGDTTVGWMLGLVWLLNSVIGYTLLSVVGNKNTNGFDSVISLLLFISRSKLVPDFALTLHFIHLLVVSLYSHSIPQNALWWMLQIVSAALMTSLGVWSCQYRELRPINFGGSATQAGSSSGRTEDNAPLNEDGHDAEQGYGRGRGRGRGRDGAGDYEMVGMKPDDNNT